MTLAPRILLPLFFAMLSLHSGRLASAGDWPQYKRNAARSGDAPDEVLAFPMNRIMALRLPAPIYASPAVAGGRIYVQDARGNVVCADPAANAALWVTNIGGVANHSSPAVVAGLVFVGSSEGGLAILDAATGRPVKRVPSRGGVVASPAATAEAVYFTSAGGSIVKLDHQGNELWRDESREGINAEFAVREGRMLASIGGDFMNSFQLLEENGKGMTAVKKMRLSMSGSLRGGPAFGPQDSCALQSFDTEFGAFQVIAWDKIANSKGGASFGDLHDCRITPSVRGDRFYRGDFCTDITGLARWRVAEDCFRNGGFHSSPALTKDHQVVGNEDGCLYFHALELAGPPATQNTTPKNKNVWKYATSRAGRPNGAIASSPAVADGKAFFGCDDGILYGLGQGGEKPVVEAVPGQAPENRSFPGGRLKGTEWHTPLGNMGYDAVSPDDTLRPPFKLRWRSKVFGTYKPIPAVAGGRVYLAGRLGQVECLDAETGEMIWRDNLFRDETRAGPVCVDGKLVLQRSAINYKGKRNERSGLDCHDALTGERLWHRALPLGPLSSFDGAVVHEGKVLAAWGDTGTADIEAAAFALADGTELWRQKYPGLVHPPRKEPLRISGVLGEGRWFISCCGEPEATGVSVTAGVRDPGVTLAIEPATGKLLWKNERHFTLGASRLAYRKGNLVVFARDGSQALNPATGELLWTGLGQYEKAYFNSYYYHPLTDAFLESKGQRDILRAECCMSTVYANGYWFGHRARTNAIQAVWQPTAKPQEGKTLWTYKFMTRACAAPAPAYSRLYYVPNGEGALYCFENAEAAALPKGTP